MSGFEPIAGIGAVPPAVSLLTSGSRRMTNVEWRSGVGFRQSNCPNSDRWWNCPPTGDETKLDPSGTGTVTFLPFLVYVPIGCDEVLPDREPEMVSEGEAQLEAVTPWHVSRELWTGEYETAGRENPSLQAPFPGDADEFDPAHIISGPLNPVDAVGALTAAYAAQTKHGGGMVLHVPERVIPSLFHQGLVKQSGNMFEAPNARVSPGPGYPSGAGDWGPRTAANPTGAAATDGQVWVYATGPVEHALGEPFVDPANRARWFDRRTNQYRANIERAAILRFDPCSVHAVLVTVPTGA